MMKNEKGKMCGEGGYGCQPGRRIMSAANCREKDSVAVTLMRIRTTTL